MPTSFLHPSASLPQPIRMRRRPTPSCVRADYARARLRDGDTRVTLSVSGPAAVIRPSEPGQISLLVERTSGDIELLWSGTADPDETWAYPFPLDGVRSVLALWRSPDQPATNSVAALIRAAHELPEQHVAFSSMEIQEDQPSAEMLYRRRARVIILKAAWEADSASWEVAENVGPALFDCAEARRFKAEGGNVHKTGMAEVAVAESLQLGRPGGMLDPNRMEGRLRAALESWLPYDAPAFAIGRQEIWEKSRPMRPANNAANFQDAVRPARNAAGTEIVREVLGIRFLQETPGCWAASTATPGPLQLGWRDRDGRCWVKPWRHLRSGWIARIQDVPEGAVLIALRAPGPM